MGETIYEFVDLDREEAFVQLCKTFGGIFKNGAFQFNNDIACGELYRLAPEPGVWVRKWKLNVSEKIVLRKLPAPENDEVKLCIVYFLNPSIFSLKKRGRNLAMPNHLNNVYFSSHTLMDFSVVPKQAFFVLDLAFTTSWIKHQFEDAGQPFKDLLLEFIEQQKTSVSLASCSPEEYKTLREIELSITTENTNDLLFIRSRLYKLIIDFFTKLFSTPKAKSTGVHVRYEQVMEAEKLVMSDLKQLVSTKAVAKHVNLSTSSLLRQFKLVFGKGIEEYYICRKMEMAKSLLFKQRLAVKDISAMFGYKQPSAFIEMFTKHQGFCPGTLKKWKMEI